MTKLALATSLLLIACGGSSQESAAPAEPTPATDTDTSTDTDTTAAPAPAAGQAAPAAPASEADYKANAEKVVTFSREIATVVVENEGNCDQMGVELQELADENRPFIEKAKTFDNDPGFKAYLEENHKAEIEAEMKPVVKPLTDCIQNPKVQAAMQSLNS